MTCVRPQSGMLRDAAANGVDSVRDAWRKGCPSRQRNHETIGADPLVGMFPFFERLAKKIRLPVSFPETVVYEHCFPKGWFWFERSPKAKTLSNKKILELLDRPLANGDEEGRNMEGDFLRTIKSKGCETTVIFESLRKADKLNSSGVVAQVVKRVDADNISVDYLDEKGLSQFLLNIPDQCTLSKFVPPKGSHNEVVIATWTPAKTLVTRRRNRRHINDPDVPLRERTDVEDATCSEQIFSSDILNALLNKTVTKLISEMEKLLEKRHIVEFQAHFKVDPRSRIWLLWVSKLVMIRQPSLLRYLSSQKLIPFDPTVSRNLGLAPLENYHIDPKKKNQQQQQQQQQQLQLQQQAREAFSPNTTAGTSTGPPPRRRSSVAFFDGQQQQAPNLSSHQRSAANNGSGRRLSERRSSKNLLADGSLPRRGSQSYPGVSTPFSAGSAVAVTFASGGRTRTSFASPGKEASPQRSASTKGGWPSFCQLPLGTEAEFEESKTLAVRAAVEQCVLSKSTPRDAEPLRQAFAAYQGGRQPQPQPRPAASNNASDTVKVLLDYASMARALGSAAAAAAEDAAAAEGEDSCSVDSEQRVPPNTARSEAPGSTRQLGDSLQGDGALFCESESESEPDSSASASASASAAAAAAAATAAADAAVFSAIAGQTFVAPQRYVPHGARRPGSSRSRCYEREAREYRRMTRCLGGVQCASPTTKRRGGGGSSPNRHASAATPSAANNADDGGGGSPGPASGDPASTAHPMTPCPSPGSMGASRAAAARRAQSNGGAAAVEDSGPVSPGRLALDRELGFAAAAGDGREAERLSLVRRLDAARRTEYAALRARTAKVLDGLCEVSYQAYSQVLSRGGGGGDYCFPLPEGCPVLSGSDAYSVESEPQEGDGGGQRHVLRVSASATSLAVKHAVQATKERAFAGLRRAELALLLRDCDERTLEGLRHHRLAGRAAAAAERRAKVVGGEAAKRGGGGGGVGAARLCALQRGVAAEFTAVAGAASAEAAAAAAAAEARDEADVSDHSSGSSVDGEMLDSPRWVDNWSES